MKSVTAAEADLSNSWPVLARADIYDASQLLRALSCETRLRILLKIIDDEHSVTDIASSLGIRRTAVSQQLARLLYQGIVQARQAGQVRYYRLVNEYVNDILRGLCSIYCERDSGQSLH
jgi:DNA-binding transcriptional ArsR family regulator